MCVPPSRMIPPTSARGSWSHRPNRGNAEVTAQVRAAELHLHCDRDCAADHRPRRGARETRADRPRDPGRAAPRSGHPRPARPRAVARGCSAHEREGHPGLRLAAARTARSRRDHDPGQRLSRRRRPSSRSADDFTQRVARGRELLQLGQADRAAYALDEALREWGGDPYVEIAHWGPAEAASAQLREEKAIAEELHVDALLASGDVARALPLAGTLVGQAPFREHRWAQLALANYRAGNQAEALEVLRTCRATLARRAGHRPRRRDHPAGRSSPAAGARPERAEPDGRGGCRVSLARVGGVRAGRRPLLLRPGRRAGGGARCPGEAWRARGRRAVRRREVVVRRCRGRRHPARPGSERRAPRARGEGRPARLRRPGRRPG